MLKYISLSFLLIKFVYSEICVNNQYNSKQQNNTSICMIWGYYNVKTFDDHGYSFKSECTLTLMSLEIDGSQFRVDIGNNRDVCSPKEGNCFSFVNIIYKDVNYQLSLDGSQVPFIKVDGRSYPIPSDIKGVKVHQPGGRIFVEFTEIGVEIKWDAMNMIEIAVDNSKGYDVLGLCGNNDKCSSNDYLSTKNRLINNLVDFLEEWQTDKGTCEGIVEAPIACRGNKFNIEKAETACQILKHSRFLEANKILDPEPYIQACVWNYCNCKSKVTLDCLCETLDVYVKASISAGVTRISWRDNELCLKKCTGDLIYQSCAPKGGVRTCRDSGAVSVSNKCEEGCYCPLSTYLFNQKCYLKRKCPCYFGGQIIQLDETVQQNCKTCVCKAGKIQCPNIPCLVVSGKATGDPHYTTWDGKRFSFMGKCIYYLVKGTNFSIESDDYGWKNGQYVKEETLGPSYPRRIIIRMGEELVELKQSLHVSVNDVPIKRFPHKEGSIIVTKPSSLFVLAELPNLIQVQWDGYTTVIVRLPETMEGKVMGLLGTFTGDQSDDFLTPDGEIVEDVVTFGNSWKVNGSCQNVPQTAIEHPCKANPSARKPAENICGLIKSNIFDSCKIEDAEADYENCVYDSCYCKENLAQCACESIAAFADECAKKGISIDWRDKLPECRPSCPAGEVYQVCNDGCSRTCEDIALRPDCAKVCIEGCNCAPGTTMDENGKCIRVAECKCRINGTVYPPGYKFLENEDELLTCTEAKWITSVPNKDELENVPKIDDLRTKCNINEFSVFTACRYPIPKTCQNMHNFEITTIDDCKEGCECMEGYVFNSKSRTCVKPENCPCYMDKRSYEDGSVIKKEDCSKCECFKGSWQCKMESCLSSACENENEVKINEYSKCVCKEGWWKCTNGQCDIWGDSHVKTFDGAYYDFQAECSFTFTKGRSENNEFKIDITNEVCSHAGATCLKSIRIEVKIDDVQENITLDKNEKLPDTTLLRKLVLIDRSLFVTIKVLGAGVEIFWDKKTWINVKLDDRWENKVLGLCGNFNRMREDDPTTEHTYEFVSKWIENDVEKCEIPKINVNTCDETRRKWATSQCSVLLSDVFSPCNDSIPVDQYYKACVMDSCKCDLGGDCECLCTAITIYAQHCNYYGKPINWRTQNLCPIQCYGNTQYQTCMSPCSPNTCETIRKNITETCNEDVTCVEGCGPKPLPTGRIYTDSTYEKNVLEVACIRPRCNINGEIYHDQEIISQSECDMCYCSNAKEVCVNLPTCQGDAGWTTTPIPTPHCTCTCPPGYEPDSSSCIDINECDLYKPCGSLAHCTNRQPGYECGSCPSGYRGNFKYFKQFQPESIPENTCVDIDECAENGANCSSDSICRNLEGSFVCIKCDSNAHFSKIDDDCVCNSGWIGDGLVCVDIDECSKDNDKCSTGSVCKNIEGTFECIKCDSNARPSRVTNKCECSVGWAGDGTICGVDTDIDGWPDNDLGCLGERCKKDNCPKNPNSGQEDTDGDGSGDACDSDSDNDGKSNNQDNCPKVVNTDQKDSDGDGIGDACDNCQNKTNKDQTDSDNDGLGNECDTDIDGDGIENTKDNCPTKPNVDQLDKDKDGIGDICDNCPLVFNPKQEDHDENSVGDTCDFGNDVDGDGVKDTLDNCRDVPNTDQQDIDHDGLGDACDDDVDNDGVVNEDDNCVLIYNPDQEDTNGNGKGNVCEKDSDGDGIIDELDSCPNNTQISRTDFTDFKTVMLDPIESSQGDPNWVIYNQGAEITQTINSDPGLAVGFDKFVNVDYEGTLFVNTNSAANYVGFVFGYQSSHKFYVVMWKGVSAAYRVQAPFSAYAKAGVQIKLVNSASGPGPMLRNALWHTGTTNNEIKLLWHDSRQLKWDHFKSYRWKLVHRPIIGLIRLKIFNGNNLLIDSGNIYDNTLKGGRLGVFCFSQEQIIWSDLQYKCNDHVSEEIYDGLSSDLRKLVEIEP